MDDRADHGRAVLPGDDLAGLLAGVAGTGRPFSVPRMRDGEPSDAAPEASH